MTETVKEYLAYTAIGHGGSWARGPNADEQVRRCKTSVEQDWGSVFDLRGKEIGIGVWDVTDYDQLSMEHGGVRPYYEERLPEHPYGEWLEPVEVRKVILAK